MRNAWWILGAMVIALSVFTTFRFRYDSPYLYVDTAYGVVRRLLRFSARHDPLPQWQTTGRHLSHIPSPPEDDSTAVASGQELPDIEHSRSNPIVAIQIIAEKHDTILARLGLVNMRIGTLADSAAAATSEGTPSLDWIASENHAVLSDLAGLLVDATKLKADMQEYKPGAE